MIYPASFYITLTQKVSPGPADVPIHATCVHCAYVPGELDHTVLNLSELSRGVVEM